MKVGYIRVSTSTQNTERQLKDLAIDKVFIDKMTGSTKDRPALKELLSYIRKEDVVYVHSLDRLARNLRDLLKIIDEILQKEASIIFIKERLEFNSTSNSNISKLMLSMLGAFAEFERNIILERQREGIAIAKLKGVYKGRKPLSEEIQLKIKEMYSNDISITKIAKKLKISRATIYKYINIKV